MLWNRVMKRGGLRRNWSERLTVHHGNNSVEAQEEKRRGKKDVEKSSPLSLDE